MPYDYDFDVFVKKFMKLTENPKKVKTIHLFNYKKIKEKLEIQSNTFFKEIEGYSHEYKIN